MLDNNSKGGNKPHLNTKTREQQKRQIKPDKPPQLTVSNNTIGSSQRRLTDILTYKREEGLSGAEPHQSGSNPFCRIPPSR